MIYFENASHGNEGFNTHLMSWTFCVSFSNFLDRDFYFDFEKPCSTPPAFASLEPFKDKFKILLESERSLVTDLVRIRNRRVKQIDREVENKKSMQLLYSHFGSTAAMQRSFGNTMMWDYFSNGRVPLIREELQEFELIEFTHTKLTNPSFFYFLPRKEKDDLLRSIEIRYLSSIEQLAAKIVSELGRYNSVHIRLGDFPEAYKADEYGINIERYKKYVQHHFLDRSLPILIATDGLDSKEVFDEIFEGYKLIYIDELIFGDHFDDFTSLEFTDFNVLTILNQLICAASESFIGTYRSTFTGIIHRLRQERHRDARFYFFADDRIARSLNEDFEIVPDRKGFFEWNKYTIFTESGHNQMGWMREWDFDQTSIDF